MNKTTAAIVLVLCACIVFFERCLPWLLFGKREMPVLMKKLSDLLPPALMAILVVYGLKNVTVVDMHTGVAMCAASVFTVIVHLWKKNQILSVFLGTAMYMILLNVL